MSEWEFERAFLKHWLLEFERRAVQDFEWWCVSDSAFDFLAHATAVEAVSERQDGLSWDDCNSAVSELSEALQTAEHAPYLHP